MSSFRKGYIHWHQAKRKNEAFPFSYSLKSLKDISLEERENLTDIQIDFYDGEDLKEKVRQQLILHFDFYKYLDEDSDYLLTKLSAEEKPKYYIAVDRYVYENVKVTKKLTKARRLELVEEIKLKRTFEKSDNEKKLEYLNSLDELTKEQKAEYKELSKLVKLEKLELENELLNEVPDTEPVFVEITKPLKKDYRGNMALYEELIYKYNNPDKMVGDTRYIYKTKEVKVLKNQWTLLASDFASDYRFTLITTIDKLERVLEDTITDIAFDTETTGLNPELNHIVGFSIATEAKRGYYCAVAHAEEYSQYNLGMRALDILYEAFKEAKRVFMFNSRFDMRMYEHDTGHSLQDVEVYDTQILAHFADPDYKTRDLKSLEKHFLGYHRPDLNVTMKKFNGEDFNFSHIDPTKALFYAAQDAISTFELGLETYQYYKEFGLAGQIDKLLMYRLMKLEERPQRIDIDYLQTQLEAIIPRLNKLNKDIADAIGDVNLNSSKQKEQLLTSFDLDTGKRTKGGGMATGKDDILAMIDRMEKNDEHVPEWLRLFNERAKLEKLSTAFFGSLLEQATERDGRVRLNYRIGNTATGRLSSGEEQDE